ncbi:MAG TPA: hypothetical protein VHA11_04930 [Bryobacteraceae bacterium]|nr:hypothetical protein [Bryobacteraceae bacterium]
MQRVCLILLLAAALAFGANVRLYLTDGTFHVVREYQVTGDRVRFYSVERSEWEEVPLSLVDLKRTENEQKERAETMRKETAEVAAEEKFEREQREERERVPQETGVFLVEGKDLRVIKQAESKVVSKKSRSVLKVLAPIPVVSGKSTVELDGEHSANTTGNNRPEFYIRVANEERFSIVKMRPKKGFRIVQAWEIVPVTKELIETQDDVEIFRKQVDEGLYKIWPMQPLEPGEYAVVEYTAGKGNIQIWDFACAAGK